MKNRHRLQKRILGLVCVILVTAVASCYRKRPRESEVLVIAKELQAAWIRNFNPLFSVNARWPTRGAIYEPLMIFNRLTSSYVPWLATSHRWNKDNTMLEFDLRQGVRWSDGEPFDAEDVGFTFDLMRRFKVLDQGNIWQFLESVDAIAKYRIRFTFKRAFTPGFDRLIHQPIVAAHVWRDIKDPVAFSNESPIGTGPYTEVIRFQNQVFELGKNPYYWQNDKFKVQRLRFPAYPSNQQANLSLIAGDIDWSGNFVPAVGKTYVSRNPSQHHYWYPSAGPMIFLYLNTKLPPFDQADVRKAISQAIDRQRLVKIALYNYTEPASSTGLPDLYEAWRPEETSGGDWLRFYPDQAAQKLDTAGYRCCRNGWRTDATGTSLSLDISVVSGWSDWVRAANVIAGSLRELGINARVRSLDFGAWFQNLQEGKFEASIAWSMEGASPFEYFRWLMAEQTVAADGEAALSNWHRFGDPRVDNLLLRFERTNDHGVQKQIIEQMVAIFQEDAPAIPLFSSPAWGNYNNARFEGFPNQDNPYVVLTPNSEPDFLLVLQNLKPREAKQ